MEISGPLSIGVLDNDNGSRELHLKFRPEYRLLKLEQQIAEFDSFIQSLREAIARLDENDANRQGMLTILQICEQLQPHINANELPLEETIIVNIQTQSPFGNIKLV